jgi:hypothetical protein
VQAPFLELTPQNQNPSRGWVSGHPGKPILFCYHGVEQIVCQRGSRFANRISLLKSRDLRGIRAASCNLLHSPIYKISQERRCYIHSLGEPADVRARFESHPAAHRNVGWPEIQRLWRNRSPLDSTSRKILHGPTARNQTPIEARSASATDRLKRCTSA